MKAQIRILIVVLIATSLLFTSQSWAQNQNTGRYIVTLRGPIGNAVQRAGGQVIHQYSIIPAIAIEVPNAALQGLARNPNILRIEPDAVAWASPYTPVGSKGKPTKTGKPQPPTPPAQVTPWGVVRIGAESAWSTYRGAGVNVAVIDTGIDLTHPDLKANIKGGINCIRPSKSPADDNGHGTHVAGTIAALNNSIGVVGVAPNASLYAVKVLNAAGSGSYSDIIEGIDWCANNDIQVANMSLGGSSDVQALEDACIAAQQAGVIIVAAAGNSYGGSVGYPAAYPSVIAVSATDSSNKIAIFSSIGPEVEIAAPGVAIYSTYKGGAYATMSGTSMASPHVAGTIALMWSSYTTNYDLIKDLHYYADDLYTTGKDIYTGYGLVDANRSEPH